MSITRTRFGTEEATAIADALATQDLWPYLGSGFATRMAKAQQMVEQRFSTPSRTARMIPTSSGTASIEVALGGLAIPAGSEVIVSPMTDPGSVTPIIFHNAIPVFADLSPTSGLITPDSVASVLTPRTSAVIAVHLTGSPVDVPGLRQRLDDLGRNDVKIIEDVAQGLGATLDGVPLGMLGDAGCFSLNSQKHISVGEGGFVLVSDEDDFHRCLNFSDKHRNRHGAAGAEHQIYQGPGHSMRMSEMQGAMLVAQLPKLDAFAQARTAFGTTLDARLAATTGLVHQDHLPDAVPTFFGYLFSTRDVPGDTRKRDVIGEVRNRIRDISTIGGAYTSGDLPIYRYPLFQNRNFSVNAEGLWPAELLAAALYPGEIQPGHYDYTQISLPEAESFLARGFWVRLTEAHTPDHAEEIADAIIDVFGAHGLT
jgi:perosamine synthetase